MGLGGRDYEDYEETFGNDEYAHSRDCGGFTSVCAVCVCVCVCVCILNYTKFIL